MTEVFLKVVQMSIPAGWLVLAVLLVRVLLKRAPKWVNVLLWAMVAVRLISPFSIESRLSLIPERMFRGESVLMSDSSGARGEVLDSQGNILADRDLLTESQGYGQILDQDGNVLAEKPMNPSEHSFLSAEQKGIRVFTGIWMIGVILMLAYAWWSYFRLRKKISTSVPVGRGIRQSEYIDSPFVLGFFRPVVYLPYGLKESEISHVVAHELAHIRRKDHWWKPLGYLLLTVYWFHPLMWVAYVLLCRDIELACDEKVIRELNCEERADYSQALLECSVSRRRIAACPLAFGEVGMKERVRNVMHYRKPGFWILVIAVAVCIFVAVCFLTDPKPEEEVPVLEATVLEIRDGYFLVEPVDGGQDSARRIEVPMEHMEASPEPRVGDVLRIEYDGLMQATDPARITNVFHISVLENAGLMINLNGIIYISTGEPVPAEIDPSAILGKFHTQVEGRPKNHGQGNFDCVDCQYARVGRDCAVLIDGEWVLFQEEFIPFPEYYLTIGEYGVYQIEVRSGSRTSLYAQEYLAPFQKGDQILLESITGREHLLGVTVTARDMDGNDLFGVTVSSREYENSEDIITCGNWVITPVHSEEERQAMEEKLQENINIGLSDPDLGIEMLLRNATPGGIELSLYQINGETKYGRLMTSENYILYRLGDDGKWEQVALVPADWTDAQALTELYPESNVWFPIDWTQVCGELEPGIYRISTDVAAMQEDGSYLDQRYSAEFGIVGNQDDETIIGTVQEALTAHLRNLYLYTEENYDPFTVLGWESDHPDWEGYSENLRFVQDKERYYRHTQPYGTIDQEQFEIQFGIHSIKMDGVVVSVHVTCGVRFRDPDSGEEAMDTHEFDVELVEMMPHLWAISDIRNIYDWFDVTYRNDPDFDVDALIAAHSPD